MPNSNELWSRRNFLKAAAVAAGAAVVGPKVIEHIGSIGVQPDFDKGTAPAINPIPNPEGLTPAQQAERAETPNLNQPEPKPTITFPTEEERKEAQRSKAVALWLEYENDTKQSDGAQKFLDNHKYDNGVFLESNLMAGPQGLKFMSHPGPITDNQSPDSAVFRLKTGERIADFTTTHTDGINLGSKDPSGDWVVVRLAMKDGSRPIVYYNANEAMKIPEENRFPQK